jgi:hypothetical protein
MHPSHHHLIAIILLLVASIANSQILPPHFFPPPDPCYRRNDTLPSCPYGGICTPTQNYTCQRFCTNYVSTDQRFWCNVDCRYPVTTLAGEKAANPMLCIQPTSRNGLTCTSGWACYRRFGLTPPRYWSQGPVCSVSYPFCDASATGPDGNKATNGTISTNGTIPSNGTVTSTQCGAEKVCVVDPRPAMAKPLKMDEIPGICVPSTTPCSGANPHECGEKSHCVAKPSCKGKISKRCKGVCVELLGPEWGTVNATHTDWKRRVERDKAGMC